MPKMATIAGLAGLAGALTLGGCMPQVPVGTARGPSLQQEMQSAHHWKLLADDIARQTAAVLQEAAPGQAIYVQERADVPFYKGFHTLLIGSLMRQGVETATSPAGALKLTYDVQLVRHHSRRSDIFRDQAGEGKAANDEVIVTAEIADDGHYLLKANRVYYVDGAADRQFARLADEPIIEVRPQRLRVGQ